MSVDSDTVLRHVAMEAMTLGCDAIGVRFTSNTVYVLMPGRSWEATCQPVACGSSVVNHWVVSEEDRVGGRITARFTVDDMVGLLGSLRAWRAGQR